MSIYDAFLMLTDTEKQQWRRTISAELNKFGSNEQGRLVTCRVDSHSDVKRTASGAIKEAPRMGIPSALRALLNAHLPADKQLETDRMKISVAWMSLLSIENPALPDTSKEGWQLYQASHLCKVPNCTSPSHLCWESASLNQSRGYGICSRICQHEECKRMLCECQRIHQPPCLQ